MNPVEEDRALHGEDDPALDERRGREAMDPMTRQMVFIAAGIGLLLVVLIGGWLLGGRHPGTIPVIQAPAGPVRVKPVDPGGMQATGAQVLPAAPGVGTETLAPQPETPEPQALQAELDAARRRARSGQPPPPSAAPPSTALPAPAPVSPDPAPQAAPSPRPRESAGPTSGAQLRTEASPAPVDTQPAGEHGRLAVQLAALDTHAAAQMEWSRLCRFHPTLFSGRTPRVEQIDRDGRTIYRLRMRGFASAAEANAFCEQARAQRVACTLADF